MPSDRSENKMMRRHRTAASNLTVTQTRAIGRMTINFNWLEHSVEVLITLIVGGGPESLGLREQIIKPHAFHRKLQVLRGLVSTLPQHYARSPELDRAYEHFAAAIRELSSKAEKLNEFRNNIVHWRPFIVRSEWEKPPKFEAASATEIDAKSAEMYEVGMKFVARAIYLHNGAGDLTFGTHVKLKPKYC